MKKKLFVAGLCCVLVLMFTSVALAADKVAVVHVRTDPKATRQGGANYLA